VKIALKVVFAAAATAVAAGGVLGAQEPHLRWAPPLGLSVRNLRGRFITEWAAEQPDFSLHTIPQRTTPPDSRMAQSNLKDGAHGGRKISPQLGEFD